MNERRASDDDDDDPDVVVRDGTVKTSRAVHIDGDEKSVSKFSKANQHSGNIADTVDLKFLFSILWGRTRMICCYGKVL